MKRRAFHTGASGSISVAMMLMTSGLFAAMAVFMLSVLFPISAFADDSANGSVAYSQDENGNTTYYSSISDAMNAGYTGKTIVLTTDWEVSDSLGVADSKSITIEMNDHVIRHVGSSDAYVIRLYEHSTLILQDSKKSGKTFNYQGYVIDGYNTKSDLKIDNIGGLVTGAEGDNGGIRMDADSKLTLDHVAVAGNRGKKGGGIFVNGARCSITMKNGATIEGNRAYAYGGGIYVDAKECTISMNDSRIKGNTAASGGGIYSDSSNTTVQLEVNSSITANKADFSQHETGKGGGIYFNYSYFTVVSDDRTGSIFNNGAQDDGGGIYVPERFFGSNLGKIEGVTIDSNSATSDGGGMYILQEHVSINKCTITANAAQYGGGIVAKKTLAFENSTITGNVATIEGGGMYVANDIDVEFKGKMIVKDNKRARSEVKDDVFLSSSQIIFDSWSSWAYIKGNVDAGSEIGIRTEISGDRRLVAGLTNYIEGSFFLDQSDSFHLGYVGSDSELWQRTGSFEYLVTINGSGNTRYKTGSTVAVNGASTDEGKTFLRWVKEGSTGLPSFDDVVKDVYNPSVTFSMPGNDVHLQAEYIDRLKTISGTFDGLVRGRDLPTVMQLSWQSGGEAKTVDVPVTWYRVSADGSTRTRAQGAVEMNGVSYVAKVSVPKNVKEGLVFSKSFNTDSVVLRYASNVSINVASVSVDDATGAMTFETERMWASQLKVSYFSDTTVTVVEGMSKAEVIDRLPNSVVAHLSDDTVARMDTANKDNANLNALLDENGNVTGVGKSYTVVVSVPDTDMIKSDWNLQVTVNVVSHDSSRVSAPVLDEPTTQIYGASYTAHATCDTEGAVIKYKVEDGSEQYYDASVGIPLTGDAGDQTILLVTAWAEKDGVISDETMALYVLDDYNTNTVTGNIERVSKQDGPDGSAKTSAYTLSSDGIVALTADEDSAESSDSDEPEITVYHDGTDTTVYAPVIDDMLFSHWDCDESPEGFDSQNGMFTISNLDHDLTVTAYYTPVVTRFDLGMDAPEAGKNLAGSISSMSADVSDLDNPVNLTDALRAVAAADDGGIAVEWSPSGDDGKAGYLTTYTAIIDCGPVSQWGDDFDDLLADNLVVSLNGEDTAATAYFAERAGSADGSDGELYLMVQFPQTEGPKLKEVAQLPVVELSFDEALEYQSEQESYSDDNCWPLAKSVMITTVNGEQTLGDIVWDVPTGFDKSKRAAQEFTVHGIVKIPSSMDANGVSTDVYETVRVAAPDSKDDGTDDGKKDDGKIDGNNSNANGNASSNTSSNAASSKSSAKATSKSVMAKTGSAVAFLMVVMLAALVVAAGIRVFSVVSKRSNR